MPLPKLSKNEMVSLMDLRRSYPREFSTDMTPYFWSEMRRYIYEKMVWRVSIMGKTRGGKSEIGTTISLVYVAMFNKYFDSGHFTELAKEMKNEVKFSKLSFGTQYIYDNESVYKSAQKRRNKENAMIWGSVHQIDEDKGSIGGIGSMSDMIESENLNNITAKFNQSEIWIQPLQLETKNCPFGLKVVQKDIPNRQNWCLLFGIEQEPNGATSFKFLGWVCIPLHNDEPLRIAYNALKNEWIKKEMSGRTDERMKRRTEAARKLVQDYPQYFKLRDSGHGFVYSIEEMIEVLTTLMESGDIEAGFNFAEQREIIIKARLMSEENVGGKRK